ncbi:Multiple RNA-binding domain-containing protein 1 [Rhodotorula toruloides]
MGSDSDTRQLTRVVFTNLHPSLDAVHLRTHIQSCPPTTPAITDLKVLARPDGSSRCIAFAGFSSHGDADRVRQWASGAWLAGARGGARVKTDWAKSTREAPRPAKRPRLAGQAPDGGVLQAAGKKTDRFTEFLAVMTGRDSVQPVAAVGATEPSTPHIESTTTEQRALDAPPDGSTQKARGSEKVGEPAQPRESTPEDGVAQDESLTDEQYLAKRLKRTIDVVEPDDDAQQSKRPFSQDEPVADTETKSGEQGSDQLVHRDEDEVIAETGRLFVRNLPFAATQADLEQLFENYGPLEQVHIPRDPSTSTLRGIAYITFSQPQHALEARAALDGTVFQGRLLHILPAVGRASRKADEATARTLKQQRLAARKANAGQAFSWAALYLNPDAALAAVADRLGVAKSALLDPSSSDPAVKVALAEAHTLSETKRYLESQHVNVDAFARPGPRSATCILVKNLPYATSPAAIRALFAAHGTVSRLLVPPSGTLAIAEMSDRDSAQVAWKALVYKQFAGSVLYLEKAPAAIWDAPLGGGGGGDKEQPDVAPVAVDSPSSAAAVGSDEIPTAQNSTLFVKNLNFATTAPRFKAAFDQLPGFAFARIKTKPDPATPGRTLSMGFGFVGFRTVKEAQQALQARREHVLDGHKLAISFAHRGADKAGTASEGSKASAVKGVKDTTAKLLVKNVPFEATRNDLRQLFSAYGQLKSVRLPRKMDNKTRGFAFVEFATRRDAEAAFEALEHIHLLGRHLVLQWSGGEDEEGGQDEAHRERAPQARSNRMGKSKFQL